MKDRTAGSGQEVEEKFKTLLNNANAARVISQAVEGTIGPKGLDTMMVDSFGDVVITNDGVTILKLMEINHPAARMIINAAKVQQEEVGDGTTTATIMASALISEGTAQVLRGVPVSKVLEGIKLGTQVGIEEMVRQTKRITGWQDPFLRQVATVAGRGDTALAELVVSAAYLMGEEKMVDPSFRLADTIMALEGGASEVLEGVLINKEPVNLDMPDRIEDAKILVIDDALKPEEIEDEALTTESG
ncbi:MAG: TCP-1/cpn60 chaperonin family protein, partial [Candidatus Saccharibacteria bacterium]